MALKFCVPLAPLYAEVPQIAEFAPGRNSRPRIAEVLTGIARRTAASLEVWFMVFRTIGNISDDSSFFIRFAFLLLAVDGGRGCFAVRNTRAPDYAGAPNYT